MHASLGHLEGFGDSRRTDFPTSKLEAPDKYQRGGPSSRERVKPHVPGAAVTDGADVTACFTELGDRIERTSGVVRLREANA